MSIERLVIYVSAAFVVFTALGFLYRMFPKKLKHDKFTTKWRELQALCKDKESWTEAVVKADALLDYALKKRKFKGKSTGERLVSAQRIFTNNDAVWFAHNLYKKVKSDTDFKIKEDDIKTALINFRQALRDVGALPNGEQSNS